MKDREIFKLLKNKHIQLFAIIFIIGIVLMIGGGFINDEEEMKVTQEIQNLNEEERLSKILSKIYGAGDVSVMITYYGTAQKDIAYETKTNISGGELRNEESEDKKAVMTGDEPMVIKETYPRVKGVIVAAEGADRAEVRQAISEAVSAVLEVPVHRICIYKTGGMEK